MDFYKIGALKVFSDLGALIEEDERNKVKFMDIPTDIIHNNIASYLLKDKAINKIFYENEDNELKFILFGKKIELPYINIRNRYNKLEVKNDELLKYINYILKQKNINKIVKKINVSFCEEHSKGRNCLSWIRKTIIFLDKENEEIAWINEVSYFTIVRNTYLKLVIKQKEKNIEQTIKKENIINECYKIYNFIMEYINKYYDE